MVRRLLLVLIFCILLSPYILLIDELKLIALEVDELKTAFLNTFVQSFLSSAATLVFGFVSALGLCALASGAPSKRERFFTLLCLVPSFIPALFFVTAIMQVIKPFPFGMTGIVLLHTLTYMGLVALYFKTSILSRYGPLSELAMLEGATSRQFGVAILKNMKSESLMVFLFVFVQCFTSFSIPLLVGHQTITMETLIFEKLRSFGTLHEAMWISVIESAMVVSVLLFYKAQPANISAGKKKVRVLESKWPAFLICIPVALFLVGSLHGASMGFQQLIAMPDVIDQMVSLILKSLAISIMTGVSLLVLFVAITYISHSAALNRFLMGYIPLSTVLVALAFAVSGFFSGIPAEIRVVLALSILFLPMLYRLELGTKLSELKTQTEAARLMGAGDFLIFQKILFPQMSSTLFFLAGLGAFWAIGDFAVSQVIFGKQITLALLIQNLVGAYRVEMANVLVILLLLLGLGVFLLFKELNHVVSQKHQH